MPAPDPPAKRHLLWWVVALVALVAALLIGAAWQALARTPGDPDALRGPMALYAMLASLVFAGAAVAFYRLLAARYPDASASLARDVRALLEAKTLDRGLRVPPRHGLGDLPAALESLVDALRSARRETVRAMATATARTEQEKGWLELILLELVPQAVVVCNLDHRILLYNQATGRLFRDHPALGLGRSLLELLGGQALGHALEGLELRHKSGRRDLSSAFVCATSDATRMLQARIALVRDAGGDANGYALSLEDISTELEGRRAGEALRRALGTELRGPLANLRAAAEIVAGQPNLGGEERRAFETVLTSESQRLSDALDRLAESAEEHAAAAWPMVEIHSPDLFSLAAHRLQRDHGLTLSVAGDPEWLIGDSQVLLLALCGLAEAIGAHAGVSELEIAAGQEHKRSFVEVRWQGQAAPSGVIDDWLDLPLAALGDTSIRDVLERHGAEPWSRPAGAGRHALHIPLQTAQAPDLVQTVAPAHPELYDFDLMYARSFTGDLGERRLKELAYVVFDTETTGLRPAAGDEIISIAAVRVTQGRVIENEVFDQLVHPGRPIPKDSMRFHGISDEMVSAMPPITATLPRFHAFAGDAVLVAHNAAFDMKFIKLKEPQCGVEFDNPVVDTLLLALLVEGPDEDLTLDGLSERCGVQIVARHSARGDALVTAHVLVHLLDRLEARGIRTFQEVMHATGMQEALRLRAQHF